MSHDVALAKERTPEFPDRCIACGRERPEETVRYSCGKRSFAWNFLTSAPAVRRIRVDVPVCEPCRVDVVTGRRVRRVVLVIVVVAAVVVGNVVIKQLGWNLRGHVRTLFACLFALPAYPIFASFPPPFDLTPSAKTITYEFRDRAYAVEFAALNDATVE